MEKVTMITNILHEHPCLNSNEIKGFIYRKYGENISAQSVAGTLRPLIAQGKVGKSNATGKMVYWMNENFSEKEGRNYV